MAKILHIFIAPTKGAPMQEVSCIQAIKGVGLEGDRYALGKGTFSKIRSMLGRHNHVSLITMDAIRRASTFSQSETRRNLVIEDMTAEELNDFNGEEFVIGSVLMRGVELAKPCNDPGKGFKTKFA